MDQFRTKETVSSVGTITSPRHALNFVKQYNDAPDSGIVSVLRLNARNEVIGVTRSESQLNEEWRLSTVYDAVQEKGCVSIVVIYGKPDASLSANGQEVESIGDLHRKLKSVSVSLCDVIAFGTSRFYSFADERIQKLS